MRSKAEWHTDRRTAFEAHQKALAAEKLAENGTDEAAYLAAHEKANKTRKALVAAEMLYPTRDEKRRADNALYLHSIGMRD